MFHALIKTVLGPKLKQLGGQFQMWVPLSQTEMGKRDRKRKETEEKKPSTGVQILLQITTCNSTSVTGSVCVK